MIQIRKYTPVMVWSGERVAKDYAKSLVGPGSVGSIILLFPVSLYFGLLFAIAMCCIAYYRGKPFRGIEPQLARRTSLLRRLFLFAAASQFIIVTTIFCVIALGATEWHGWMEARMAMFEMLKAILALG